MTERRRVFSREELEGIRYGWVHGCPSMCPICSVPLLSRPISPRKDVAYVRRRHWLLCPRCQRSALVETHSNPGRGADPGSPLPQVGWREWVGLPSLGIGRIKAKVDTGARSSSLHATDLEEYEQAGRPWIRFTVLPSQKSHLGAIRVRAPLADRRAVRPSSGRSEVRPVVKVQVQVGDLLFPCEVTLARRDQMGFRMLLGRTALRGRFLVDAGRSYLQSQSASRDTPGAPRDIPSPKETSE